MPSVEDWDFIPAKGDIIRILQKVFEIRARL